VATPRSDHHEPTSTDQAAELRRLVIRARARGDKGRAEVYSLLLAMAEAGAVIPDAVIEYPPAYIHWAGEAPE
jgi:hypothetical protein